MKYSKIKITVLVFAHLIQQIVCVQDIYELIFLPENGAKCLDGSDYGIYYQKGTVNKYLIILEGGGACLGFTNQEMLDNCGERAKMEWGTSKVWSTEQTYIGMFSGDGQRNQHFADWNKVYFPYCDGLFHTGYSEKPFKTSDGRDIYFRGYNNTVTGFNYALNSLGMNKAETVILTGYSAGAMATFMWSNYLKGKLSSHIQFLALPDSPYFPRIDIDFDQRLFKGMVEMAYQDTELILPSECVYKNHPTERYKCIFMQYTMAQQNPTIPIMILQSLYDSWVIYSDWEMSNCLTDYLSNTLTNCTQNDHEQIGFLTDMTRGNMTEITNNYPHVSVWAISCIKHCFTYKWFYNDLDWSVPEHSQNTAAEAVNEWVKLNTQNLQQQQQCSDKRQVIYLDQSYYPNNSRCNGIDKEQ